MSIDGMISYRLPRPIERIDIRSTRDYFRAKYGPKKLLNAYIIVPMEEALQNKAIEEAGLSDNEIKILEKSITFPYNFGEIMFEVTISPKVKRPEYTEAYNNLIAYLKSSDPNPYYGLIFEDGKMWVYAKKLVEKANEFRREIKLPGISKKVKLITGKDAVALKRQHTEIEKIEFEPRYYNRLSDLDAMKYAEADSFLTELDKRVGTYKELFQKITKWSRDNPPKEAVSEYKRLGPYLVVFTFIPQPLPKYADVFNKLLKPVPGNIKDIEKNKEKIVKTAGELVLLGMNLDFPEKTNYEIKNKIDGIYISTNSAVKRLETLKNSSIGKPKLNVEGPNIFIL